MQTIVTAMEARKRFGEILNRALYRGVATVIKRKGTPIAKVVPIPRMNATVVRDTADEETIKEARARLKGSVLFYHKPFEPVGLKDWEALQ